jgi:HemY protein
MLHLLAADSAHALQDQTMRDSHVEQALQETKDREVQDMREAVQLTATRWAVQDRDWPLAQQRFDELPQGAARRTVALRLRFKMARMSNRKLPALEEANTAHFLRSARKVSCALWPWNT